MPRHTSAAMRRTAAAAALGLAVTGALPAGAMDMGSLTDDERAAFRAEVRSYLLDNPEVLMEAIGILENREAQAQAEADQHLVESLHDAIYDDGVSWVGGNPEGDVTLVEFLDYRCGYCRRAHDEVSQLVETDGNIRFILKEFPILGEDSVRSSRFAIATRRLAGDAVYKTAHDRLITLRGPASEAALRRLASDLKLDPDAVFAEMDNDEITAELQANRALASDLQINGTPTFILDDDLLRGYVPLAQMTDLVEAARAD